MYQLIKRVFLLRIRKRKRYRLKSGAYVVLNNFPGKFQIEDIGFGGLSFHCVDSGLKTKNATQHLKIIAENYTPAVHLSGRIVSENETGELIFEKKKIKRRSIQFERMNSRTKVELEAFIKDNKDLGP